MTDEKKIDYGNVPITKLPPGKAYGADDLQRWAMNRASGHYGTGDNRSKAVILECPKCGAKKNTIVALHTQAKRIKNDQRICVCGSKMTPIMFRREGFRHPDSPKTVSLVKKKRKHGDG